MTCDHVRDQLAEHLLGTLEPATDAGVRGHLRGCSGCRRELQTLEEGVAMFARAAHEVPPPEDLRDRVLGVLREEWDQAPATRRRTSPARWLPAAAVITALAVSLAWGVSESMRADRYDRFLQALDGRAVRVGTLEPSDAVRLEGSVVLYDSKAGQSWALVLVRAPGLSGEAGVTLSSGDGATMDMHPMTFDEEGRASTWLVTRSPLDTFDTVTVWQPRGHALAQASVEDV